MNEQVADLVEGIGDFIEYWGFKKIHGKIWALVFLSDEPVDAKYLIENLGVSKALISISLKDLIQYKVIFVASEKNSTVHYVSNPNLTGVITNIILSREAKMILKIKNSCELLEVKEPTNHGSVNVSRERVKKLRQMTTTAERILKTFITLKQFNFKDFGKSLTIKP